MASSASEEGAASEMPRDQSSARPQRLLQITDTHLFADPADTLVGMNCEEGLQDVLALARAQETAIAALLCTGDLSQDASEASYRRFHAALAGFGVPQYWIPGNHDDPAAMRAAAAEDERCLSSAFSLPHWRVVLLNSKVPGKVHGRLAEAELQRLDAELQAAHDTYVLVCLHHNSVPVDAAWLQRHALQNSDALLAVLDRHPGVRAVVFGHIHQDLTRERNGVLFLGAPSTCVQFHPSHDEFALHDVNPGYRWLDLYPDGRVTTGVHRVPDKRYAIDFSGAGY